MDQEKIVSKLEDFMKSYGEFQLDVTRRLTMIESKLDNGIKSSLKSLNDSWGLHREDHKDVNARLAYLERENVTYEKLQKLGDKVDQLEVESTKHSVYIYIGSAIAGLVGGGIVTLLLKILT